MLHPKAASPVLALAALAMLPAAEPAVAQTSLGTAFTYQGQLSLDAGPVEGNCDLNFDLFETSDGGAALDSHEADSVALHSGRFTVELDFGEGAFGGRARWLELGVRCPAGSGSFTMLSPRQKLTAAPYALWTAAAGTVPASGISGAIADSQVSNTLTASTVPASGITGSIVDSQVSNTLTASIVPATGITGSIVDSQVSDTLTASTVPATGITGSIVDSQVSDTLTASSVPATGITGSIEDSQVSDTLTASSVPATGITGSIEDSQVSDTLTASTVPASGITGTITVVGNYVGIGTTNPLRGLHVSGGSGLNDLVLEDTQFPPDKKMFHIYGGSGGAEGNWVFGRLSDAGAINKTFMRIDNATGNVGIGSTSPGALLQLGDVTTPASEGMIRLASHSGGGPASRYWDIGVPQGGENTDGKYYSFVIDDPQLGTEPEVIVRWDTGNVGIGRVPSTNKLEVEGNASKTTSGSWLMNSDRRLKTDIRDIDNALEVIDKLRPVQFRYTEAFREKHPSIGDKTYYGYIAQEFQQVFPDSVQQGADGYLQVDIHNTNVYAVQAVQELHELLKAREAEITAQKAQLQRLEARLAALEATVPSTATAPQPAELGGRR